MRGILETMVGVKTKFGGEGVGLTYVYETAIQAMVEIGRPKEALRLFSEVRDFTRWMANATRKFSLLPPFRHTTFVEPTVDICTVEIYRVLSFTRKMHFIGEDDFPSVPKVGLTTFADDVCRLYKKSRPTLMSDIDVATATRKFLMCCNHKLSVRVGVRTENGGKLRAGGTARLILFADSRTSVGERRRWSQRARSWSFVGAYHW